MMVRVSRKGPRRHQNVVCLTILGLLVLMVPMKSVSTYRMTALPDESLIQSRDAPFNSTNAYPLKGLSFQSPRQAYERGFWQRMRPVPMERWQAVSNATCVMPHEQAVLGWKRKIPHLILIGAQKGGTTALSYYLYNHPSIQYFPTKELHYFDEELDQNTELLVNGSGIQATKVFDYFVETTVGSILPLATFQMGGKYALDATPNYMFLSDRVPPRIFCAVPWVKLLAVLRNPVDRAYSQYHMQFHHDLEHPELRRGYVSFEEYIELDMKVMQETGVLPKGYGGWHFEGLDSGRESTGGIPDILDLNAEALLESWSIYTKLGLNSPVGRGLYALQLHQWYQFMDSFEKPRSDLKVIPSERLLDQSNQTYAEILEFLELPAHSLPSYSKIHETQYRAKQMNPEIRNRLEGFYQPFNQMLVQLLGSSEWNRIWETGPKAP